MRQHLIIHNKADVKEEDQGRFSMAISRLYKVLLLFMLISKKTGNYKFFPNLLDSDTSSRNSEQDRLLRGCE